MYICIYVYVFAIATCVNVRGCYRSLLYHRGHEAWWQCFYPLSYLSIIPIFFSKFIYDNPPPPCVCAYAHSYATVQVWKSEDNLQHPVLSSHHLSPGTHAVGLGSKCLYLLHSLQPAPRLVNGTYSCNFRLIFCLLCLLHSSRIIHICFAHQSIASIFICLEAWSCYSYLFGLEFTCNPTLPWTPILPASPSYAGSQACATRCGFTIFSQVFGTCCYLVNIC